MQWLKQFFCLHKIKIDCEDDNALIRIYHFYCDKCGKSIKREASQVDKDFAALKISLAELKANINALNEIKKKYQ